MKLLYVGDTHIRGTNPRNRTDSYKDALKSKLHEIHNIAANNGVQAILCAGDIFDKPEVSAGVLLEFADVFADSPVPWYTTPGNHDLYSYNLATYNRTSLALLERIVPNFHVLKDPTQGVQFLVQGGGVVEITFTPYTSKIDKDGYGYSPETRTPIDWFKIHVAHGMLLDHVPPFDRYSLVQNVETTADLVLTGHDHTGYGIYRRADGKTFVNCGSLTRLSASVAEIERTIQVLLIDVQPNKKYDLQLIPLETAKPGVEILDRTKIEAEKKRQYAMEGFAAAIQTEDGAAVVDIEGVMNQIAAQEAIKPSVVKLALEKIHDARLRL